MEFGLTVTAFSGDWVEDKTEKQLIVSILGQLSC